MEKPQKPLSTQPGVHTLPANESAQFNPPEPQEKTITAILSIVSSVFVLFLLAIALLAWLVLSDPGFLVTAVLGIASLAYVANITIYVLHVVRALRKPTKISLLATTLVIFPAVLYFVGFLYLIISAFALV